MRTFTALFDACVLYPQTMRDALLSLARSDLFLARWSAHINEEWTRARLRKHPEQEDQIRYTLEKVNQSVDDCLVTGYEHLIDSIVLPDPDDRHVVAAAIIGRADVIVTVNTKHFPAESVARYDIEVFHPDDFIIHQFGINQAKTLSAFRAMRARYRKPSMTAEEFLANLERAGLTSTAATLRPFVELI